MSAQRFYSVGYVAHHLGCEPDDLVQLINRGVLEADADVSGDVLVIEEGQVERAKAALRARSGQDVPVIRQ